MGGPIPPKKRLEFEKWQKILAGKQGNQTTLSDTADFSEATWRTMCRGAGESDRAYAYRAGTTSALPRKNKTSNPKAESIKAKKATNVSSKTPPRKRIAKA